MNLEFKKQINDNVHGYIGVTEQELRIIDNPVFQRLRHIRQLGATDLVFPGATHTRFSHSVGTMFVVDLYTKNVIKDEEVDRDQLQKLRIAALLHDVGHYPLSHTAEALIVKRFRGKSHVENGIDIIRAYFKDDLENYSAKEIIDLMSGKNKDKYSMLISSALDADKSDYMLRDSYESGVSYGSIDLSSVLRIISFED
ncbi:MAG: HD domain-containing protein, partial [Candidatus Micrarchaeota archaeon]|nr:HD domain-containing protein [Candidatus Micrarchaeota archaeon]